MKKEQPIIHDLDSREDSSIQALIFDHGMAGYGMFWTIIEELAKKDKDGYMIELTEKTFKKFASIFKTTEEEARRFVLQCVYNYELLAKEGEHIKSTSLIGRMEKGRKVSQVRKEAAKKAADARWASKITPYVENLYKKLIVYFEEDLVPKTDKTANIWMREIERLMRIDGLTEKELIEIVRKTRNDDFWRQNFLTIMKLRRTNKEGVPYWRVFKARVKESGGKIYKEDKSDKGRKSKW